MMGEKMMRIVVPLVAALVLAGCGGGGDSAGEVGPQPAASTSTQPAPPTQPAGPVSYSTVVELRDAAVAAGYVCPSWKQDNQVQFAAESGSCSDADVFATYASEAQRAEALATAKELGELMREQKLAPDPRLFGPNWSIATSRAAELAKELGGTVVQ
jgi:hypothetical protein